MSDIDRSSLHARGLGRLTWKQRCRYSLETVAAYAYCGLSRLLPVQAASALGGFLMRVIGPRLGITRVARKNLMEAFPEKSTEECDRIIAGMWDNLGRVLAEYPHLSSIGRRVEVVGGEHFAAAKESGQRGRPSIFFGAHIGNWEVSGVGAKKHGLDVNVVYRRPNNPWVDGLLRNARSTAVSRQIAKGADGARELLSLLKRGEALGILMDQKLSNGVAVPFFGRDAMTAPAPALFALRFDCDLYPTQTERLPGARFRLTIHPPMTIEKTGNREEDVLRILTEVNRHLEDWIRARPEQWLWIHRRWHKPFG